ncbi:hypothetical protein AgCh_024740 [Apium graveolens]
MPKKLKLQGGGGGGGGGGGSSDGCNYFENLPDELVILIFTKLSSSINDKNNNLDDIKSLGRCSSVSKRFNALTCLVPALSIQYPNMATIFKLCPKILKKFKHIHSLQVTHLSSTELRMRDQGKPLPFIFWEAAYRPHSYSLAVVSCKKFSHYSDDPQKQQLMCSDIAAKDFDVFGLIRYQILDMICLHHMLVSLIKDHKYLQRVVVTDLNNRGMLTLENDQLVELRNCTRSNLEQVVARDRSGSVINLNVPSLKPLSGLVMNNFFFSIIEWWEKDTDDFIHKDEEDGGIPRDMHFICHEGVNLAKVLTSVMENPDGIKVGIKVNDDKIVVRLLSLLNSEGYLP